VIELHGCLAMFPFSRNRASQTPQKGFEVFNPWTRARITAYSGPSRIPGFPRLTLNPDKLSASFNLNLRQPLMFFASLHRQINRNTSHTRADRAWAGED
jgi:hypothetical protein